ncbi:hypothetical protein RDABS01_030832 [Bienertia sinuspersici]
MSDHPTTLTTTTIQPQKFITGADSNGCALKDALITHLHSLDIPVEDLGVGPYYSIADQVARKVASSDDSTTRGIVACGTGVGVQIFANKTPSVYAATCLTPDDAVNARSINNANVLAVSGMSTSAETAIKILNNFISTPFKAPCPASGGEGWDPDIEDFLDNSLSEMGEIGKQQQQQQQVSGNGNEECAICCLAKNREFVPVEIMPGGMMKIVRESPTSAIIKFKSGSIEPAHHHKFGHDLYVIKGKKSVWNLSKNDKYDLVDGDYLFTPAGDVHRVKYYEDTEFFLKWDGPWDIVLDEDLESAKAAIAKEEA